MNQFALTQAIKEVSSQQCGTSEHSTLENFWEKRTDETIKNSSKIEEKWKWKIKSKKEKFPINIFV